jgi:hypothetical protein
MKTGLARRFKERILRSYFVRCDMSLILAVVVASGVGASKLMLELGVQSLEVRYPLALLVSFGAFLLLIRIWIWYVFCRPLGGVDLGEIVDLGDLPSPGGGGGPPVRFGGGSSGGGGASDQWSVGTEPKVSAGSGGGGGSGGLDFDAGDDWAILLLLAAVILAIVCAGGYLIYVAPHILPEAAWQASLGAGLARIAKPAEQGNWLKGVLRASILPFVVVLALVMGLAHVAHSHCPQAAKLAEALTCGPAN